MVVTPVATAATTAAHLQVDWVALDIIENPIPSQHLDRLQCQQLFLPCQNLWWKFIAIFVKAKVMPRNLLWPRGSADVWACPNQAAGEWAPDFTCRPNELLFVQASSCDNGLPRKDSFEDFPTECVILRFGNVAITQPALAHQRLLG